MMVFLSPISLSVVLQNTFLFMYRFYSVILQHFTFLFKRDYQLYWIEYVKRRMRTMYEEMFPIRLAELRTKKGVSARDMSLSIGQNPGYINNIETGKALPSMSAFFFICDFLGITPKEFFDTDSKDPEELRTLAENLKKLDQNQLQNISSIVKGLIK